MVDYISQLPDDILISIISRTRTEEAVRTSILSKRWRNLYKFVSTINFLCHLFVENPDDSILEVYKFLQLHSGCLRSFDCRCCLTKSSAHVFEQCIYSLGKLGIEKFRLQFSCIGEHSDLPFSCHLLSHMPSLKDFVLMFCSLQPNLKSHCNSLKSLKLTYVKALPGSLECILSNCLSLCTLMISHCECPSKLCFRGRNLQLKCLMIHVCEGVEDIEFYASNLITFEFYNPQMVNFIFDYIPQLQNIYLSLFDENVVPYVCGKLGKDFPKLKSLVFETKGALYQDSSIPLWINMFGYLKRLELILCYPHEINLLSLTPLLHSCPLLQEFHLVATDLLKYNGPQVEKHIVFHSQLKNVNICGFGGTKNEMDFALYILKSAVGLQKMSISRHASQYIGFGDWAVVQGPPWSEGTCKNIQEQLKHQAVSKTVQLIIQQFPRIRWKQFDENGILVV